jgi:nitroreductase
MQLDEIIRKRYSVRAFDERPVARDDLEAMAEAARLAPSACNSQTWRFVTVTDRDRIQTLCDTATRSLIPNKFMRDAPVIIAGCSQLDIISNRIGTAVTGIEYYRIDLGIAMEHMVLKATELGLGTCWIGWFNEKRVKKLLQIPRTVRISALLAVGYPVEDEIPTPIRKERDEILFWEKWHGKA